MKIKNLVIITLSLMFLFGLSSNALAQDPDGDFAVIQAAAEQYLDSGRAPVISADALWENLGDGDVDNDPFILSVRKPEHYAIGHIPGAVNVYWKDVAKPENLAKLPTDKQIVVYCYTGHTGQIAATALNLLGYDAVNLKFGIMGWTEDDEVFAQTRFGPTTEQRDYRVEQESHQAVEAYAYPELNLGVDGDFEIIRAAADRWLTTAKAPVMSADALWENLNDGDTTNDPFILSVRASEHYTIGHIPGAVNVYWKEIAKPENLAKLPADQPITAYCYTGHTGQVATTILGMLGYEVSNLKYGMMAWTEDDEVFAQTRFGPDVQRDYRIETATTPAAPVTLPATGGPAFPQWLVWLMVGLSSLAVGLSLRRLAA